MILEIGTPVFAQGWHAWQAIPDLTETTWVVGRVVREDISDGETIMRTYVSNLQRLIDDNKRSGVTRLLDERRDSLWKICNVLTEEEFERYRLLGGI